MVGKIGIRLFLWQKRWIPKNSQFTAENTKVIVSKRHFLDMARKSFAKIKSEETLSTSFS